LEDALEGTEILRLRAQDDTAAVMRHSPMQRCTTSHRLRFMVSTNLLADRVSNTSSPMSQMPINGLATLSIRESLPSDAKALGNLLVEIQTLHVAALPSIFRPIEQDGQTEGLLTDQITTPDAQSFIAEEGGKIVGYIWVRMHRTPPIHLMVPRQFAEIDTLVVAETHRRAGVGRALVTRAQDWAIEQGADEIRLVVYEFNQDAIRFYERLGFTTSRRTMSRRVAEGESMSESS
jgi:ribosomal protein S18 acetylase RimI-like enzyme